MAMIFGILSRLSRVRITLGYAAILVAVSVALVVLGPRVRERVSGWPVPICTTWPVVSWQPYLVAHSLPTPVRCGSGCPAWSACSLLPS